MKILRLISLAVLCTFFAASQQDCSMHKVEIVCREISNASWFDLGYLLTCWADSSVTSTIPGSSVSSVVHINGSAVTNNPKIEGLTFIETSMKFIPTGIMSQFPNLRGLSIVASLLSVKKENLKEFGSSLESLILNQHNITSIDADLFIYNPNLKEVRLFSNPIRHIDSQFFANLQNLKSLQYLDLQSAGCMSQVFSNRSGHNIDTFEWNNENCNDESAKIETQNSIYDALCWEARVLRIPDQIIEHANEINEASIERFEQFESNINTRIDSLEKANQMLMEENAQLRNQTDSIAKSLESVLKIVTQIKCLSNNQKR